jgi:leucyl aminopeptidase
LLVEGAHLGGYRYDECRGKGTKAADKLPPLSALTLSVTRDHDTDMGQHAEAGRIVGEALTFARDLVNAPGNVLTARALADRARTWGREAGLKVEILDKGALERLGCGGILAVNQGSAEPPRMIVMRHRPRGAAKGRSLALVGKGVTFDTGGISLKPGKNMHEMKSDMAGAAAVIAAMGAIGRLNLPIEVTGIVPIEVTGIVPATDNMPDGNAIKPGDVITHLNGKTVEILNTDAEGRLILADALAHACREVKPTHMVNFATLTGACVVALGERISGVMGNDDGFREMLCRVAGEAGEQVWPLPLNEDFTAELRSDVADLANIAGSRWAGAETAGAFLQEFVSGPKWCHVDIAGPSYTTRAYAPYATKGGTGCGVHLSVRLAEALAEA